MAVRISSCSGQGSSQYHDQTSPQAATKLIQTQFCTPIDNNGKLALPESVSALPMFAELVVEEPVSAAPSMQDSSVIDIVVGDVTIRADASAEEGRLTRVIRAARFAVR